jgi:hypothetical protein
VDLGGPAKGLLGKQSSRKRGRRPRGVDYRANYHALFCCALQGPIIATLIFPEKSIVRRIGAVDLRGGQKQRAQKSGSCVEERDISVLQEEGRVVVDM